MEDTEDCCAANANDSHPNKLYDFEVRPSTPPNNISICSEVIATPSPNYSHFESEPSFIRRIDLDRLNKHRLTSTPLMSTSRFSNTLPNPQATSSLSGLIDYRQCQSADSKLIDTEQILCEYVNPFTPDGKLVINKAKAQRRLNRLNINPVSKFVLLESDTSECSEEKSMTDFDVPVRHRLNEINVARFNEEFVILEEIGKGDHGCVFKCMNRINGCIYAIKRTIKPIKSSIEERIIRNEIYAHGALDHRHIVRNFSCWNEGGYVFIQNEYCNGGNLEDYVKTKVMTESLLHSLLLQMSHALRYIHKKGLAHMDVKPGNILLCIEKPSHDASIDSDGGFSDEDKLDEIVFKLADLGHVIKLDETQDVEEGDCRYLPRELLEDKLEHLDRADIFSLALSVYEVAGGGPLPKNGEEWQNIRNGNLRHLEQYTKEFNKILKSMVQVNPESRPSADQLVQLLEPNHSTASEDVFGYLQKYRRNNSVLEHRVQATGQYLKLLVKSHKQLQEELRGKAGSNGKEKPFGITKKKGAVTKNRAVGKKTKRSSSTTLF